MLDSSTVSAPIALFVHRRPWHTKQTLQALARNEGARMSPLYVFADAARSSEEAAAVAETREVARNAQGFASVDVIERSVNIGLAQSLIEGIDVNESSSSRMTSSRHLTSCGSSTTVWSATLNNPR